jgi:predicted transcriptional regulator
MGATKTESFSKVELRAAELAKALGHPARISILQYLATRNECVCGDIVDELPLSQSTVSQHLKELKNVGLIRGRVTGVNSCYCIDRQVWKEAQDIFAGVFQKLSEIDNCC